MAQPVKILPHERQATDYPTHTGYWCPGDTKRKSVSARGVDQVLPLPEPMITLFTDAYMGHQPQTINSLAPGGSECDSKNVIFNLVLLIGIFRSSHDDALQWMPQDLTDDKSTLVQVMAWCLQASSHYLSQCWPRSLLPNGVTRPQLSVSHTNDTSILSILTWYFSILTWVLYSTNAIPFGAPLRYVTSRVSVTTPCWKNNINTLRLRKNGRHFADSIFKCIILNENVWISLKISLKFVPKVQIKNIPALV